MGLQIKTKKMIQDGVDALKPFVQGNIKGTDICKPWSELGKLPEPYRGQYKQQAQARLVRYMIYHYQTPIAWVLQSGTWIVPKESYSVSTTGLQNVIKTAISEKDFWNKF